MAWQTLGRNAPHRFVAKNGTVASQILELVGHEANPEDIAVQRDILRVGFMTDELKYLRCYGAVLGHEAMRSIPAKRLPSHAESLLKVDYENVDLAKVLSNVKRTFPLRFHPLWKESNR